MLEKERHNLILKLVNERSIVSVGDLLDLLGASEVTIRRDINALAEKGEVKRIRGGAEAVRPRHQPHLVGMPFAMSQDVSVPQKRAIARAAAALIEPGESIIINGGTTTFALVEFLENSDLDILTNSFPIAAKLFATSRNRITLPGGTIFREQNIVLSPFENDTIESLGQQAVCRLLRAQPLRHDGSRSAHRAGADQAAEAQRTRHRDGRQLQAAPQVGDDRGRPRPHQHH